MAKRKNVEEQDRIRLRKAGLVLKGMREDVYHLTQRQLEDKISGQVIPQQVSKLERGAVERPSMHDLVVLGEVYDMSPNEMAKLFGYWNGPREDEPEDPRLAKVKSIVGKLEPPWRDRLLDVLETDAVLWASQAKRADLLEELG